MHHAKAAVQFSGGVGRHRDVAVELRHVYRLHVPASETPGEGRTTEKCFDVVVHALAGQPHERRPLPAAQPPAPDEAAEIAERGLVADFDEVRLLVAKNVPNRAGPTEHETMRKNQPVTSIDPQRPRRPQVIAPSRSPRSPQSRSARPGPRAEHGADVAGRRRGAPDRTCGFHRNWRGMRW